MQSFEKSLLFVCFILIHFIDGIECQCPNIVPYKSWSGTNKPALRRLPTPVQYTFIHHTAGNRCTTNQACIREVKSIQAQHKRQGWGDIGYNFIIGGDGRIYEGRGWTTEGIHTRCWNSKAIAICFIGNYQSTNPSTGMTNLAKQLINCGHGKNFISRTHGLYGHRDANPTACPGNQLYNIIKGWPRFRAKGGVKCN